MKFYWKNKLLFLDLEDDCFYFIPRWICHISHLGHTYKNIQILKYIQDEFIKFREYEYLKNCWKKDTPAYKEDKNQHISFYSANLYSYYTIFKFHDKYTIFKYNKKRSDKQYIMSFPKVNDAIELATQILMKRIVSFDWQTEFEAMIEKTILEDL